MFTQQFWVPVKMPDPYFPFSRVLLAHSRGSALRAWAASTSHPRVPHPLDPSFPRRHPTSLRPAPSASPSTGAPQHARPLSPPLQTRPPTAHWRLRRRRPCPLAGDPTPRGGKWRSHGGGCLREVATRRGAEGNETPKR